MRQYARSRKVTIAMLVRRLFPLLLCKSLLPGSMRRSRRCNVMTEIEGYADATRTSLFGNDWPEWTIRNFS